MRVKIALFYVVFITFYAFCMDKNDIIQISKNKKSDVMENIKITGPAFFDTIIKSKEAVNALKKNILANAKAILLKSSKYDYKIESIEERQGKRKQIIAKHNLIALKNMPLDITNIEATKLLRSALRHRFHDGARLLLNWGINPNLPKEHIASRNALHICIENLLGDRFSTDIVELLLQKNMPINEKNYKEETPLHLAVKQGYPNYGNGTRYHPQCRNKLIKILLQYGADSTIKDKLQKTPLYYSARKGNMKGVYMLLKYDAMIDFDISKPMVKYLLKFFLTPKETKNAFYLYVSDKQLHAFRKAYKIVLKSIKENKPHEPCFNITPHVKKLLKYTYDPQLCSILHDWGVDLVKNGVKLTQIDDEGKTIFHEIMESRYPDVEFIQTLLHYYNLDHSMLNKQLHEHNTMLHLVPKRVSIEEIIVFCTKLYNINKKELPSNNKVSLLLLMLQKRKTCIMSAIPRKLLLYLINDFGFVWQDTASILTKELLSIKNGDKQTAYDILQDKISSIKLDILIALANTSTINIPETEKQKILQEFEEAENTKIKKLEKIAWILDPHRRN